MHPFIVLEGGEGVGKTTLREKLRAAYPELVVTREPGGTPFAEQVREFILSDVGATASPESNFHLFWAARAAHVGILVKPMLGTRPVLCDRFDGSTFAYQVRSRHSRLNQLFWIAREVHLLGVVPVYLILDVDETVAQERVRVRNEALTHFDAQRIEEHRAIRHGFLHFAQLLREGWGEGTAHVLDASQSADAVFCAAQEVVNPLMRR